VASPELDQPADSDARARVASARELIGVAAALLVLTALMIAAANLDMSASWRGFAILLCLSAQAVLVGLSFMGLRRDQSFHALIVVIGLLVVLAFIAFTSMDAAQSQPNIIWRAAEPAVIPP